MLRFWREERLSALRIVIRKVTEDSAHAHPAHAISWHEKTHSIGHCPTGARETPMLNGGLIPTPIWDRARQTWFLPLGSILREEASPYSPMCTRDLLNLRGLQTAP